VRFVGMSGTLPHLRDHIAMGVFDVFQIPYSAMEREHEAAIAAASAAGSGLMPPSSDKSPAKKPLSQTRCSGVNGALSGMSVGIGGGAVWVIRRPAV